MDFHSPMVAYNVLYCSDECYEYILTFVHFPFSHRSHEPVVTALFGRADWEGVGVVLMVVSSDFLGILCLLIGG